MFRLFRTMLVLMILMAAIGVRAQSATPKPFAIFGYALQVVASADGQWLATFENMIIHENEVYPEYLPIRVYDIARGQVVVELIGEADYPVDIAFSSDGSQLAALYQTGWLYVWSIPDGEQTARLPVVVGGSKVAWLPDSEQVAVGHVQPSMILVWDVETGMMVNALAHRFPTGLEQREAYSRGIADYATTFAIPPDSESFAVGTVYGNLEIWERDGSARRLVESEDERPTLPYRHIRFTDNGDTLVAAHTVNNVTLVVDVATGEVRHEIPTESIRAQSWALSPDGSEMVWLIAAEGVPQALGRANLDTGEVTTIELDVESPMRVTPFTAVYYLDERRLLLSEGFVPNRETDENVVWVVPLPE